MIAILADLLTSLRVVAASALVWLGLSRGAAGLTPAVWITVAGWTTDQLDGWVARRSPTPTRLGRYDFHVDVTFYAGILAYLVTARLLPWLLVAAFLGLALLAWVATRRKAVAVLCLRLVDLAATVIIFRHAPRLGWGLLVWAAVLGVIYRKRLAQRVPRWLADLRAVARP